MHPKLSTLTSAWDVVASSADTETTLGVGAVPDPQSEVAADPGVIVIVHESDAARVAPQVVARVVPLGSAPLGLTTTFVAAIDPAFVTVICRGVPVSDVFKVVSSTDKAREDRLSDRVACANVTWTVSLVETFVRV